MTDTRPKPRCYGVLDTVFPMGEDGLRHVPSSCRECAEAKACLAAAAASPAGVDMRAERMEAMERTGRRGLTGFLGRWADLKAMRQAPAAGRRNRPRKN